MAAISSASRDEDEGAKSNSASSAAARVADLDKGKADGKFDNNGGACNMSAVEDLPSDVDPMIPESEEGNVRLIDLGDGRERKAQIVPGKQRIQVLCKSDDAL